MQRPNYWPRSSYNPRDGSWVQSWYGTSYAEGKSPRNSAYENAFFYKNHVQRSDVEYCSSSNTQAAAENRNSSSFVNPTSSTNAHHSPLSDSVSPNSSFSESSYKVTPPRHHYVSIPPSPQSHGVEVSSPMSYHSDEASPRLNQSSPAGSQQFFDLTAAQNSYDYTSPSGVLSSSKTNSLSTAQSSSRTNSLSTAQSSSRTNSLSTSQLYKTVPREVHSDDSLQVAEPASHSRSYIASSRNDRIFNNCPSYKKRYEMKGDRWPTYKHHRQSFSQQKKMFADSNRSSYANKSHHHHHHHHHHHPHHHKLRSGNTDRDKTVTPAPSPTRENNASVIAAPLCTDKSVSSVNATKSVATAPPVEKSITDLISKLFNQPSPSISEADDCDQEKNVKSGNNSVPGGETKLKSKGSPFITSFDDKKREKESLKKEMKFPQNSMSQNKTGVRQKSRHSQESASSTTKMSSDKVENVKKNNVLKPNLKSSQPLNLADIEDIQNDSTVTDPEFVDKQSADEVNASNNMKLDDAFVTQKPHEYVNRRKEPKNLRARISIGSGKKLSKDSSTVSPQNSPEHISPNSSGSMKETFNGYISSKSPISIRCSKNTPSKTLKARKSGWENCSYTVKESGDELLCNGTADAEEGSFEPKARKSFRPHIISPTLPKASTEQIESDLKDASKKKKKRRHFRGGRYTLFFKPKRKKEKKGSARRQSDGSAGDESSDTCEMTEDIFLLDNSNSGDLSRISNTSESFLLCSESNSKQMPETQKSFTDVNSVLKLPLNDVLWSRFEAEKINAKDTVKPQENSMEVQQNSPIKDLHISKSRKLSSTSDCAKSAFGKTFCGVARKSQVSYRQQTRTNANSSCAKVSSNMAISCKSKSGTSELGSCISNSCAVIGNNSDLTNQDSDIEIVAFVEKESTANSSTRTVPAAKAYKRMREKSSIDRKKASSLIAFSSDSDDEVSIKRRKRASSENLDAAGNATNGKKQNSLLCDGRIGSFYTKDSKLPKSLCTCLGKSLCDSNTQFPEEMLICQAVDTIDGELVTCRNSLAKSNLVRPSLKIPYVAMCESHLSRLRQHHCCPNCGFFCTQGVFLQCITTDPKTKEHSFHFFHHTCQAPIASGGPPTCPHCGSCSEFKTATLKCSTTTTSGLPFILHGISKRSEQEVEECNSELSNENFEMSDDGFISGSQRIYIPDELQIKSMAESLATEKSINLRPSGKNFYAPVKSGDIDKVLQLLVMGVDPNFKFEHHNNDTPLHVAAEAGFPLLVHVLIQAGACINLVNNNLYTPIMLAVEKKHIAVVQCLIMAGAQQSIKSEEGMTCLHLSACGGNALLCKMILESSQLKTNIQDDGGWTPLVWAAEHRHYNIAKLLIDRGADASIMDKEKNVALHWAAFSGSAEIAQLLLDSGSRLDVVNEHGDTPLHIAAREDNYECVVLFLARGASISIQNCEGNKTPIMCCKSNSCPSWLVLSMHSEIQKWKETKIRHERVVSGDISRGKEEDPIQVVNGVDDEEAPSDFYYVTESCETSDISIDKNVMYLQSCKCEDNCTSKECSCSVMSFQCWYDKNGCLIPQFDMSDPPLLFECNKLCMCWKTCRNRVVQFGITCRLQIFRTKGKGWGVRTLKNIPKGTFICEYVGELISDLDADHRNEDSYLFDLDSRDSDTYCLDARYFGNVSRFINHLCDANLVPVKVFVDHHDLKFPRIAFFSSRDIKAFEELGFDYGEKFWMIKCKWFHCECCSPSCRYSSTSRTENTENLQAHQGGEPRNPS